VNKKAQTAESSNAGVSLPIDGAYPLNPDGSLVVAGTLLEL
jgi:maltose alpha-D-glucosyltransferase/alpha-amylase